MHQLRPLFIADPERCAAALAVIPVGRPLVTVDRRIPHPERASAFDFESVGSAHDIDRVSAGARTLAADRAIAVLIRVRRVTVDAEADRSAATGAFETHRHLRLHRNDRSTRNLCGDLTLTATRESQPRSQ